MTGEYVPGWPEVQDWVQHGVMAGHGSNCAPGSWLRHVHGFDKICPEPRTKASRLGVDGSSGELIGMAHC